MPKLHFPHPLALLTYGIILAAALTYVLPAGEFDRREDPLTGRTVVVPGTYHRVSPDPVGPFEALVALPRGMVDAGAVIFFVFLVGGAFVVVDRTGALRLALDRLVRAVGRREALVIPITALAFAAAGALENFLEEIIALVPLLLLLSRRMGFDALTAVAMSLGAAMVGAAFSPVNPFQVGIAQKLAELPLLSGGVYRMAFLALALAVWIAGTMRHALRNRVAPSFTARPAPGGGPFMTDGRAPDALELGEGARLRTSDWIVLLLVVAAFAGFIFGLLRFGWGFEEMAAVFFLMGVLAGLVAGLRVEGTARAFVDGFRDMAFAGLLIGFARAIYVVLNDGRIVDTIVNGLFAPLGELPVAVSAVGMMAVQTIIHVPVPSVSGQAVLTLPILVPLSDLLGLARQVTVLAYQYGAGLCELLTPTNGALMAVIAAAGVRFEQWLRFVLPLYAALAGLGIVAILIGIAVGVS
ncbi:MAG: YfcC family protein [Gemmatimonadetes bacterium]|nr:YfcC family protein [Gemmatimonadota bacterium]